MSTGPDRAWQFAPLVPHRYGVILADPGWHFKTRSAKGRRKSPKYTTQLVDQIMVMPVELLAAKDCVLMLWFTQNFGEQAYAIMRAWGFEPKTLGSWAKRSKTDRKWAFGTGYLFRNAAEFYLFGTRGKPRQAVKNIRNLIVAPVRSHSEKPDEMHCNLERMYPDVPRCELFARKRVTGWDCWGDELGIRVSPTLGVLGEDK